MKQEQMVAQWFNEHPESLIKYPNHWVAINLKRMGVMVSDCSLTGLVDKLEKYEARKLDPGQSMEDFCMVHTAQFKGKVSK